MDWNRTRLAQTDRAAKRTEGPVTGSQKGLLLIFGLVLLVIVALVNLSITGGIERML